MKAYQNYIAQQKESLLPVLPYAPLTVVIPCYDEPEIVGTLQSLWSCIAYDAVLHVIVVINHSTKTSAAIIAQNDATEGDLKEWKRKYETRLHRLSVLKVIFPHKESGVGAARKLGMDEAVNQYIKNEKDGIIASLDADTVVEPNYLAEIYRHFQQQPNTNTLIVRYEHPFQNLETPQRRAIIQYELYLRYMTLAYRHLGHPDAFHTIGSAFAVKASAYCKQGGMNRRQAGEDFYFLQKMFLLGDCYELNISCVYPSARTSERVPFGTGKAVKKLATSNNELQTYSFQAFEELKVFFDKHLLLYKISKDDFERMVYNELGGLVKSWLIEMNFFKDLEQINNNCASETMFSKKFFERFSIFQIIKYLNFVHLHFLQKVGIFHAVSCLNQAVNLNSQSDETLLLTLRETLCQEVFAKK